MLNYNIHTNNSWTGRKNKRTHIYDPELFQRNKTVKLIVRLGDTTNHGGVVTESIPHTNLNGKPMAGKGHMVMCPLCKGPFPIAEGSSTYSVNGISVALDGMKTTCGATLIASNSRGAVHR
jgi:uncharacterized Zn-binding protein involved in type VI secretion